MCHAHMTDNQAKALEDCKKEVLCEVYDLNAQDNRYTVQLKFNFTLARKDMCAFASFLRGITEYFLSI